MQAGDLATLIQRATGKRPSVGLPPAWVLRSVAAVSELASSLSGKPPLITRALLDDAAGGSPLFTIDKAKRELGYTHRGAAEVVDATLQWARRMGWVRASATQTMSP